MSYSVFLRWFCTTSICECLPDQDDEPVGFLKLPKEIKAKWTPCILAMRNGWNWATQTLPDSALRLHMFWTIRTYSDHSLRPHCVTSAPNSACHGWTLGEGLALVDILARVHVWNPDEIHPSKGQVRKKDAAQSFQLVLSQRVSKG